MVEWDDVKHMQSYQAFERFKAEPKRETFIEWEQAAQRDIALKGYAYTGYTLKGQEIDISVFKLVFNP